MAQSVYRIVGVHYNDLLDFLHTKGLKHGGVDGYLKYVSGDAAELIPHQIELMMKVATTIWAIENLRTNSKLFWATYAKNNNALRIIIILMATFIGCFISYLLFSSELPKLEKLNASTEAKIKVGLIHTIIYLIVLAVLLVMEKNFNEKTKEGRNMVADIDADFVKFNSEILGLPEDVRLSLQILLYDARQSADYKKRLYDTLKSYVKSQKTHGKTITSENLNQIFPYSQRRVSVDRVLLYKTIKTQLNGTLLGFYDNGNGYLKMRKIIVSSNTIMMIREMKASLNYYYSLIQAASPEIEEDDVAEEKKRAIIDTTVVAELKKLNLVSDPSIGQGLDAAEKNSLIQENVQDDAVEAMIQTLVTQLCYFAYFCYPLFKGLNPMDPAFPITGYVNSMPQNESLTVLVYQDMKDTYNTVFNNYYAQYLATSLNTPGYAEKLMVLSDMFNTHFKQLFKRIFIEVSYAIKGGYLFIFDAEQMTALFKQSFAAITPFSTIRDGDFIEAVSNLISYTIIDEMWKEYQSELKTGDQLATLKADIVSDVSTNLVKTPIQDLARYKAYILEKLANPKMTNEYSQTIASIDKELQIKRVSTTGDIFANEAAKRFISEDDFIAKIDRMSFRDIYNGFKTDYLLDIVSGFYVKISENTQGRKKTLKDIYYTQEKTLEQVKILLIVLGHILVLTGAYYTIVLYEERERVKSSQEREISSLEKEKPQANDPRLYLAYKRHRNSEAMYWMKIAAMYVALFFFLMLMISFYKKARAKFDFNKETIEANTAEFKGAIDALNSQMQRLKQQVTASGGENAKMNSIIGKLGDITKDDKLAMHKHIVTIVDKFEKCNYINVASKVQLPFPYTEITMDMFMLAVTVLTVMYMTNRIHPLEKITKIKDLRRKRERIIMGDTDDELMAELDEYYNCHVSDMDSLMFAVRIVVFLAIIMFMIFYSSLVISSSNQFKAGLYNSLYFEQGRCVDD